jgi:L-ascorbate metabolism protein UlaG (beta-lactamase superfamily)
MIFGIKKPFRRRFARIGDYFQCRSATTSIFTFFSMHPTIFGKAPSGHRLERIRRSPNFNDGKFQNLHHTPQLTEGYSIWKVISTMLFRQTRTRKPTGPIPSVKSDLVKLKPAQNALVWFGHSSYFLQVDGKKFLIDPVFSGNASPIPGSNRAFPGSNIYSTSDLPDIDYLMITHDHYDHLDHDTVKKLRTQTKKVISPLGVGSHLEHWGYEETQIIEKDWYETVDPGDGCTVHVTPARHFSGLGFIRNTTLWCSYILETPSQKIFIGGDSGYDTHYADIGKQFGPFDLAILECGQYNPAWKYIHETPEETLQAAHDLRTKRLIPVHCGKFAMANHPWDEPLRRITEANRKVGMNLVTPLIGEIVELQDEGRVFEEWWLAVK